MEKSHNRSIYCMNDVCCDSNKSLIKIEPLYKIDIQKEVIGFIDMDPIDKIENIKIILKRYFLSRLLDIEFSKVEDELTEQFDLWTMVPFIERFTFNLVEKEKLFCECICFLLETISREQKEKINWIKEDDPNLIEHFVEEKDKIKQLHTYEKQLNYETFIYILKKLDEKYLIACGKPTFQKAKLQGGQND